MKLKMKMTLMAGALALAVAGQANASIVTGATGSSDLVLSIWDTTTLTSYTADLGVNMASFRADVSGTNTALTAGTSSYGSHTFVADALLSSFLSSVNMATTVWNVTALDSTGTTAFEQKQMLATTNVNIKSAANSLASAQANSTLLTGITNANLYYTSASGAAGAATSVTAASTDSWYANSNAIYSNLSSTTAGIGSSLNFWYLTPSSQTATAKASVAEFGNAAGVSTWKLASDGTLTYNVAAVPEPGEWLLMLSGLGLIGFIATRRRNNAGSMTFA